MLHRITDHDDAQLARTIDLRTPLMARARAPAPLAHMPLILIGRHPTNNVVITTPGMPLLVSRQHAAIAFDGAQYTLYDLNTTNGTYVNTVQMPRNGHRVLRRGNIISFGGPTTVIREGIHLRNPFHYRFEPHADDERALASLPADQLTAAAAVATAAAQYANVVAAAAGAAAEAEAAAAAAMATSDSEVDVLDAEALIGAAGGVVGADQPAAGAGGGSRRRGRHALETQTQLRRSVRQRVPVQRYADEQSAPPLVAAPVAAPVAEPVAEPVDVAARPGRYIIARGTVTSARLRALSASAVPAAVGGVAAAQEEPPLPPLPTFAPPSVDPLPERSEHAIVQRISDDMQCDICHDLMVAPHVTKPCAHTFCGQCITEWFRRRATCPLCRGGCVGSTYVRALDNLIRYVVEPTLDADTNAERDGRRVEWQNMQQQMALEIRQRLQAQRRAGIVVPNVANRNMQVATAAPMMARILLVGAAAPAGNDAAPDAWGVDYASSGACICYQCLRNIPRVDIRVRRTIMSVPAQPDELAEATENRTRPIEFFHLACRAPRCAVAEVRGLESLQVADRQRVEQAMSAAAAPAAAA